MHDFDPNYIKKKKPESRYFFYKSIKIRPKSRVLALFNIQKKPEICPLASIFVKEAENAISATFK